MAERGTFIGGASIAEHNLAWARQERAAELKGELLNKEMELKRIPSIVRQDSKGAVIGGIGNILNAKTVIFLAVFLALFGIGGNIIQTIFKEVPLAILIGVIAIYLVLK